MDGTKNGYGVSTQYINTSLTGTAMTECKYSYFSPNPNKTDILPGLPATTAYDYTTVLPFGDTSWNTTSAFFYGLNSLASEVATFLHLSVPNCTSYGGGSGTVKIGVTALTSVSILYTNLPQAVQTPEKSTSTSRPQPAPSSYPPSPPTPTAPISTVLTPTPSSYPPVSLTPATPTPASATPTASISAPIPPGVPNEPGQSNSGSYITTIIEITSGPSGLETLSEMTTLALGSYILSIIGINGATEVITASTSSAGLGPGSTSSSTTPGPAAFTGDAYRLTADLPLWTARLTLAWLAMGMFLF
jgi:hypothetical protein